METETKKQLTPQEVYDLGESPSSAHVGLSHYIYNAVEKGLGNYRYLTLDHVFSTIERVPRFIAKFLVEEAQAVCVGNLVAGGVVSIVLRSVKSKSFILYGASKAFPYGIGMLPDGFAYGTPLILVEGVLDRDAIIDKYPNTVSILGAGLSSTQIEILTCLTHRFVLAYDRDEAGERGMRRDQKRLSGKGMRCVSITCPPPLKDFGDLAFLAARRLNSRLIPARQAVDMALAPHAR